MTRHEQVEIARITRVEPHPPGGGDAPSRSPVLSRQKLREAAVKHRWFLGIVVVPTLLAGLYFGLIAADLYVSEARFIVRKGTSEAPTSFGSFLQGSGFMAAQDDSLAIKDFIMSRDAVRRLDKRIGLRAIVDRPESDFLMRFPRLFGGTSFEQLHRAFDRYVEAEVDTSSGITTLKVKTFRPDDSYKMASALLGESEALVNRLNHRAQQDAMTLARSEVTRAENKVIATQDAITAYRLRTKMLDPASGSTPLLELIGSLSAQLAVAQAQLRQTEAEAPNSPQLGSMRQQVRALESQVAQEKAKVVGNDQSMVLKISEYERLFLQRQFAEKQLASALLSQEAARLRAQRDYIYLNRVVEPNLADYPLYPRRLYSFLIVLVSSLLIYGIGRLVSASVKEHVGR
jgi:capsular polysaccharide transport system permease protein